MKKRKLRKWVKVVLTIILIGVWIVVYDKLGILGNLAQTSNFYLAIDTLAIFYISMGNFIMLYLVWEN